MLINDEAIATRLNGASDRGEWDKNVFIYFIY